MKQTNKKAQEEVMGFVIIVLVVMIIGLIFFAFSLRKPTSQIEPKQAELDDFLNAMLAYTTECKLGATNLSIRDLVKECNNNPSTSCTNREDVCSQLDSALNDMFKKLQGQGVQLQEGYVNGYVLNISNSKQLVYIEQGNLTGDYFASSVPVPTLSAKDVIVKLRFYYSKG